MGEIKSVKVDNWGVFFLQKLQNFFNKTDYCDLTLQFRDNSQLKVHRLVLSACTDYFNVLEQTCEMIDDALIMPNELQADVVVPIVNFMYTGTLEFELKMYGKLLRTAKDMNMTVLLKLLEAHRRTMEGVNRMQRPPSPKPLRRRMPGGATQQPPVPQQRRLLSPNNIPGQRRIVQTKTMTTNSSTSTSPPQQTQYRQQIGSTSLIRTSSANTIQARQQYSNQSLLDPHQTTIKQEPEEPTATSPFEQLRKGYNNNKRPASTTLMSPPTKKLNIEDVKEFAEQQRMRKQIAAEYGDDQGGEYESSMMEDDIHNDDDDDDLATTSANANALQQQPSTSRQTQMQHGSTTITINQNEKPPTIVVKDSSNSKMNHAKIIKEVLRQYPHLVKSNKNIKLKIMPSSGDQPQKIIVKKEQLETMSGDTQNQTSTPIQTQSVLRVQTSQQTLLKPMEKSQTSIQQQNVSQSTVMKMSPGQQQNHPPQKISTTPTAASATSAATNTATTSAAATAAAAQPPPPPPPTQKRRIDSKTMHALIALGAENTTGPWLCLRCGVNGRPISIPSYRGFRRHLINTHKEYIDPALCEHCGWRSNTKRELHYHMEVEHKVKTTSYTFPNCLLCSNLFLDTNALNQHMLDAHPDENKQQCIYCNKIFARELQLYNHMKTYHKKQALDDGIIDYSDEEFCETPNPTEIITQQPVQQDATTTKEKKESKIKILSDISLPSAGSILELGSENNTICADVGSQLGISSVNQEDYIDTNESSAAVISEAAPKFVTVDGAEMVLTDEQRQEIMAQLNQEHGSGGVVMVLNEPTEYPTETQSSIATNDEEEKSQPETEAEHEDEVMEDLKNPAIAAESSTVDEELDDSHIYNELHTTPQHEEAMEDKKNTSGGNSALDESKESIENLEWAENLISEHEMADQELEANKKEKENKNDDIINQKLKELTGDWSEDENDEELEEEEEQEMEAVNIPNAELKVSAVSTKRTLHKQPTDDGSKEDSDEKKKIDQAKITEEIIEKSIEEQDRQADIQSENIDAADDNKVAITKNEIAIDEYATTTNVDDLPKGDEDDLDTIMKNLHKDDVTSEAVKDVEKEIADEKTEESDAVVDTEKEAIKEDVTTTTTMLKDTQLAEEDESTTIESDVKKTDDGTILSDNLITLERDVLLEDLIGNTSSTVKEDELTAEPTTTNTENIITKTTHVETTVESESSFINTETTVTATDTVEAMEVDKNAKAEDVDMTEQEQPKTAAANVDDKDTDVSLKDGAITTTITTTTTSSKTNAIDANADAVKPSERVKSLISEWGDDEEEEEEGAAEAESCASVAATNTAAVDEEQL